VLFTISATITSPGQNGAVANLVETVYKPVAVTPTMKSDLALLKAQCTGLFKRTANPQYMGVEVTSTLAAGSAPWPVEDSVGALVGGPAGTAWSGAYRGYQTYCGDPLIDIPGVAKAVGYIPSGRSWLHAVGPAGVTDSVPQSSAWAIGEYGFEWFYDVGSLSEIPKSVRYTFSNCAIQLSPYAAANPATVHWPNHAHNQPAWQHGCVFGH
jgi:hypothetical protein